MAAYREHLSFSSGLGVLVGLSAASFGGFTGVQATLAALITALGGILPDLDSESGRPVREIFGMVGAIVPMMMFRQLEEWGGNLDGALLLAVLLFTAIRYGGADLLALVAVHRGMFHSIPAMCIAGEVVFLSYKHDLLEVKILMAAGVSLGFLSHLVLDEIYSVQWNGIRVRLAKSAGSAVKFFGRSLGPNIVTYGLLFALTYALAEQQGLVNPATGWPDFKRLEHAADIPSKPAVPIADRYEEIDLRRR